MIRHIVLFQFPSDVPQAEIDDCVTMLRALPSQIAEIRAYEVAYHCQGRNERYQVALLSRFDDEASLHRYGIHPAHAAFVERVQKSSSDIIVFDYDE